MAHPRILLIAESADPNGTDATLEGWQITRALANVTDTHVVTHARHRTAFEAAGLVHGQDFTAIGARDNVSAIAGSLAESPVALNWAAGAAQSAATAVAYARFEEVLWLQFRDRLRSGEFAVVHRVTPQNAAIPSPIAARLKEIDVPFVLGPITGTLPAPQNFSDARRSLPIKQPWMRYVREAYQFLPGYRSTRGCASAIIIGSREAGQRLPRGFADRSFYIPTSAVDDSRFTKVRTRVATRPIKVLFAGPLTEAKGADMLLEAAAPLVTAGKITLDYVGDGPLAQSMYDTTIRDGLDDGIRLHGPADPMDLQEWMIESDLLALPSVRETNGQTVLEAMSVGLPCAVVDYGTPGDIVTEQTGFLVPPGARHQIIASYRELMHDLWNDPEFIESRTHVARQHVAGLTWAAKANEIAGVYHWLLHQEAPAPRLPMPMRRAG
ncbi:MAG TPA: glycosyltransferase [Tepidisphaeraceae bacterium]|jgi:glycosyltransferase involved in cell wall biosynthesis|nr:glycosyltransferase [Tepidisphaeraceae bacterium]